MNELKLITDRHTISFGCTLPGSPDWVWWHLTESTGLREWLADGQVEARLGGTIKLRFQNDDALVSSHTGAMVRGVISCYEPCRRLAYSWADAAREICPGEPAETSRVSFDLTGDQGRTSLSLTHTALSAQTLSRTGTGWHTHLQLLANVLSEDIDAQTVMQSYAAYLQRGTYVESFIPRMRA